MNEWIRWRLTNAWLDRALKGDVPDRWRLAFADLLDQADVVPRADAEALAHAVSLSMRPEQFDLTDALSEYLAKHPWSDL